MSIIDCAVSNVAIATALAIVAALVSRVTVKPQVARTLWLLVLVKLVTPPLVHIPGFTISESVYSEAWANSEKDSRAGQVSATPSMREYETDAADPTQTLGSARLPNPEATMSKSFWPPSFPAVPWTKVLVSVWGAGSITWYVLAGTRLSRFRTLLRSARQASEEIETEVRAIASRYRLQTIPRVLVAHAKVPPLISGLGGRVSIVLPHGLLRKLDPGGRARLLAHELAHLKRGDLWVRWFEFAVLGIYWWNPIAWWARAQIQQAEEECCDAWVLWAFPDRAPLYAQTLMDTVDFLAVGPQVKPDIATAFNQGNSLKRRIEMIMSAQASRWLSWRTRMVLVLFALAVTPLSLLRSQDPSTAENAAPTDTALHDAASRLNEPAAPTPPAEQTTKPGKAAGVKVIRGTVVDQQGEPIAGTSLWYRYAFDTHSGKRLEVDARSDAEGRFNLEVPTAPAEDGFVRDVFSDVWAWSPNHCLGSTTPRSDPADIRIELTPATDTSLVVLDPEGRPMAGALVEPINYRGAHGGYGLIPEGVKLCVQARTDAEGRVRLPAMARDRLSRAWITTKAYGVQTQQFTVKASEPAERSVHLRPVARIEGRVIAERAEWARGKRIVFTTEKAWGPETRRPPWPTEGRADVVIDKEGRFKAPVIAEGRLSMIQMVLDERLPVRPQLPRFVDLTAGETIELKLPMARLINIRGSILAEDTRQPLAGVELHVYYGEFRQGTDVHSDVNGQFSARVLPGRVRFQPMNLSKTKYLQFGSPPWYNVPDDGFELPAIEVVPSKSLDGRLLDQDGSPVAGAEVIAYYSNWLCSTATTGKNGRFNLPKMPVSIAPDEATYRVQLGIGETRFMHSGGVETIQADPFVLRVKR